MEKLLVTLEYEITGDTFAAMQCLYEVYHSRQSAEKTTGEPKFEVRCIQMRCVPETEPLPAIRHLAAA